MKEVATGRVAPDLLWARAGAGKAGLRHGRHKNGVCVCVCVKLPTVSFGELCLEGECEGSPIPQRTLCSAVWASLTDTVDIL